MSLILDTPDSARVTRADLSKFETLKKTPTYFPVPYNEYVDFLHERIDKLLPWPVVDEQYGIAREGRQMFGCIMLDTGHNDTRLTLGCRASNDKSLSLAFLTGINTTVCSNLLFNGDIVELRRHTGAKVWEDLEEKLDRALIAAQAKYSATRTTLAHWMQLPVTDDRGAELLGLAHSQDVLTLSQFAEAMREWLQPSYTPFEPRTARSLYAAITGGLKKGAMGTVLDRHKDAHNWFVGQEQQKALVAA